MVWSDNPALMSDANSTVAGLINPDTPLAFFDPTQGYQSSVSIYVEVSSAGVMVWDLLDNIRAEYRLLFKTPFSIVTLAYFGSRIGSLGYAIAANIFQTAPTGNCIHSETITDVWYPIGLSCSGLLFFFRLRAIYNRDRLVVACFFVLWLGLLACTMLVPIGVLGGFVGNTKYCIDADVPPSAYAAVIAPLVHDTLVFLAITWRLTQNAYVDMTLQEGFRVAVFGKYLPAFSKGLLRDGQRYYLISLISNLVVVVMVFDTSVPITLRSMGATSNIVITNIMACRVYRSTRFGKYREQEISTSAMQSQKPSLPIQFVHPDGVSNPSSAPSSDATRNMRSTARSKSETNPTGESIIRIGALPSEDRSVEDVESQKIQEK